MGACVARVLLCALRLCDSVKNNQASITRVYPVPALFEVDP